MTLTALAAAPCGDLAQLERSAARARLPEATEACLTEALSGADPKERARVSFVLILSAYAGKDLETYGARMKQHLEQRHTTDAEVAYLYARYLWERSGGTGEAPYTAEILRWSRVAMDGRVRWLHNRSNYDEMVRNLYDMLVQTSMQDALARERVWRETPDDALRQAMEQSRRRARHYLIVAAPCLHRGECGPTFEVVVEGLRECDELGPLEAYAAGGKLDDGHRSCLRARFRRPGAPKGRILEILATDATNQVDPAVWEYLLAWHYNVSGEDDTELAWRFSEWLANGDTPRPGLLVDWASVALDGGQRSGKWADRTGALLVWRSAAADALVKKAKADLSGEATERHKEALARARAVAEQARAARVAWCSSHTCPG